jgi:hypothetical protein
MRNRVSVYAGGNKLSGNWRPTNGVRVYAGGKLVQPATILLDGGGTTRTINVRGTNGAKLYVDYGDGSVVDTITLLGAITSVPISHAYAVGTYMMRIYGDYTDVTYMVAATQGIQSIDVSSLTETGILRLTGMSISDITSVGNMRNISDLQMFSNDIVDISAVEKLLSPGSIRLNNNSIVDITPIRNKTSLHTLMLHANSIEDCSAIENLSNLIYGRLYSNSISTLPDTFPAWDSCEVRLDSNGAGFPTDECLEKMAASGMTNNDINIAGTGNPPRTQPDTDAYVATIIGNGNTLTVN